MAEAKSSICAKCSPLDCDSDWYHGEPSRVETLAASGSESIKLTLGAACSGGNTYTKGSPSYSNKDWYHGELSRVEAEQALAAFGRDCFLVRVSEGALILSLIHHGILHHLNIKYTPKGYSLLESPQELFQDLQELVACCRKHEISETLKLTLGAACTMMPQGNLYAKGSPSYSGQDWYHGELSQVEAERALTASGHGSSFLVRVGSEQDLILSLIHNGRVHHIKIQYTTEGYSLHGSPKQTFQDLQELIAFYRKQEMRSLELRLGVACGTPHGDAYTKGLPSYSNKDWYHGELSRVKAEQALAGSVRDCFLVRVSKGSLVLSLAAQEVGNSFLHIKIKYSPSGYSLQGMPQEKFEELQDLVAFYSREAISNNPEIMLGKACERTKESAEANSTTGKTTCTCIEATSKCSLVQIHS